MMRMFDIIQKKKHGGELTAAEIHFVVTGFSCGDIPDYQMSALLMAVCLVGMTKRETLELTMAMAHSGDVVDLSQIKGIKTDKHSTGGVGDKTTLIISPIVASCGVPVAKMSGKGLGHTGGTIDKLESIKGLKTSFDRNEFISIVQKHGLCIAGQSGNLAPADKKIYALRDVTATIDSIPLIAASIMSKKIAAGADCILLDVKTGNGAFMKTVEDSRKLAHTMVEIGEAAGKKTVALITDMNRPLGKNIGNSLEVIEAAETLKGRGPKDLTEICIALAAEMLALAGLNDCRAAALNAINSGAALAALEEMVSAQGGSSEYIRNPNLFEKAPVSAEIISPSEGYIYEINAEACGLACSALGAGRERAGDPIDYTAGIVLNKTTGDYTKKGDVLAVMHSYSEDRIEAAREILIESTRISSVKPDERPLIYDRIAAEPTP